MAVVVVVAVVALVVVVTVVAVVAGAKGGTHHGRHLQTGRNHYLYISAVSVAAYIHTYSGRTPPPTPPPAAVYIYFTPRQNARR